MLVIFIFNRLYVCVGLINNLPLVVAFFSINVPAGLGVYWILNNLLTTIITVVLRKEFDKEPLSMEVSRLMAAVDAKAIGGGVTVGPSVKASRVDLRRDTEEGRLTKKTTTTGFGKTVDVEGYITSTMKSAADSKTTVEGNVKTNASIKEDLAGEEKSDEKTDEKTEEEEGEEDDKSSSDDFLNEKRMNGSKKSSSRLGKKKRN
jgi:hypothetical protein